MFDIIVLISLREIYILFRYLFVVGDLLKICFFYKMCMIDFFVFLNVYDSFYKIIIIIIIIGVDIFLFCIPIFFFFFKESKTFKLKKKKIYHSRLCNATSFLIVFIIERVFYFHHNLF
jgi:hypothetical protein